MFNAAMRGGLARRMGRPPSDLTALPAPPRAGASRLNFMISMSLLSFRAIDFATGMLRAKDRAYPPLPAGTEPRRNTMTSKVEMMETMIPKGHTIRIQDGKGLDLTVVTGSLWVTYESE